MLKLNKIENLWVCLKPEKGLETRVEKRKNKTRKTRFFLFFRRPGIYDLIGRKTQNQKFFEKKFGFKEIGIRHTCSFLVPKSRKQPKTLSKMRFIIRLLVLVVFDVLLHINYI